MQYLPISIIALAISAAALIVSLAGYRIARRNYQAERLIVLKAIFEKDLQSAEVESAVDGIILQAAEMIFPSSVSEPKKTRGPRKTIQLYDAATFLANYLGKMADFKPESGVVKIREGNVPVFIASHYVAKGTAYSDLSLYLLHFVSFMKDTGALLPHVKFDSMMFLEKRHLRSEEEMKDTLDKLYDNPSGTHLDIYAPFVTRRPI